MWKVLEWVRYVMAGLVAAAFIGIAVGVGVSAYWQLTGLDRPVVVEPLPVEGVVESCAYDVLVGLDEAAEGTDAVVPRVSWGDAVRACEGTHPEVYVYEDGSVSVFDSDWEFPPFVWCMAGEDCLR